MVNFFLNYGQMWLTLYSGWVLGRPCISIPLWLCISALRRSQWVWGTKPQQPCVASPFVPEATSRVSQRNSRVALWPWFPRYSKTKRAWSRQTTWDTTGEPGDARWHLRLSELLLRLLVFGQIAYNFIQMNLASVTRLTRAYSLSWKVCVWRRTL